MLGAAGARGTGLTEDGNLDALLREEALRLSEEDVSVVWRRVPSSMSFV